jgi:glycosyltransferase involved in cell wall biosynthesis
VKIVYHHRVATRFGQAIHMEELISALRAAGHEVVVVGPAQRADAAGSVAPGVRTLKERLPRALYELLGLAYNLPAFVRLLAAVLRHRPDVIYERYALYLMTGIPVARLTRTPLLLEVNAPMFEERDRFSGGVALRSLGMWAERTVWRGADVVLPVSEVLATVVAGAGVPADRIEVTPNGIQPDRFASEQSGSAVRERFGLGDRVILGFTGFVREWHGVERLVALLPALAHRNDVHLLLVGDGPARAALERQAAALGVADRFTVTGNVEHEAIPAHIAAFDIAVQIGVTPYASPLKLLEYMAMGRAIVAPDTENIREILTAGSNALLFEPNDDTALQAAIERLAADPALRDRLGAAARRTIVERDLTWTANAERVVAIVRDQRARPTTSR